MIHFQEPWWSSYVTNNEYRTPEQIQADVWKDYIERKTKRVCAKHGIAGRYHIEEIIKYQKYKMVGYEEYIPNSLDRDEVGVCKLCDLTNRKVGVPGRMYGNDRYDLVYERLKEIRKLIFERNDILAEPNTPERKKFTDDIEGRIDSLTNLRVLK